MPRRTPARPASPITDELIRIIESRGLSVPEIARRAGIAPSTLTRFLAGQRSLKVDTLDLLAAPLGLRLTGTARPAVGRRREVRGASEAHPN
jgi:transcriptional regulator with XRE-family HTH domain